MTVFYGVDMNVGDVVEVTYRQKVTSIDSYDNGSAKYLTIGDQDYYTESELTKEYPDGITFTLVSRAFPANLAAVIENEDGYVFTRSDDGQWFCTDDKLLYDEDTLGSATDYKVLFEGVPE